YLLVLLGLLVLASPESAMCSKNKEIEGQLRSSLQDKVLLLRGLPTDNSLAFDSQLNLTSEIHPGPWYAAEIEVHKIQVKDKEIKIDGYCLAYVDNGINPGRKIEIKIAGPFTQDAPELLALIRNRVFVMQSDELSLLVPKPWQDLFLGIAPAKKSLGGPAGILPTGELIYRVGSGVTPPRPIHVVNPEYSEEARSAKYQGVSVLGIIVNQDGRIVEIHIARPLEHGLDQKAIEAVRQWTFQPAFLDGRPVAVIVNVEVSFNLY
ncbi:MAG: outer rane transport energization protein TonB, partial [Candidatus Angelobacter sp.]|nr:outer rane transport energization protein TonB [Candidatus Angelobacter sp.]